VYQIVTLVSPVSIFDANIFICDRNIAILHFAKSGTLGHTNPCVGNIYQCTKFEENIFIYDRDIAKSRKFKMAAAAILNFARSGILATVTLVWPISISVPNLTQVSLFTTEIWPKFENSSRHLEFLKSVILGPSDPCMANICLQTKFGAKWPRDC